MAACQAILRTIPALSCRAIVPRPRLQTFKMTSSTEIPKRRLQAVAKHLKPATSTAVSTPQDYPTSHEQIDHPIDTHNFLDNEFVLSKAPTWMDLFNPATNSLVTRVPQSTTEELQAAVRSAEKAFPAWRATSIMRRQQAMFR
jgi:malonate-semialdehyde dehydrogenase (acetylating) / methylmalonate-semialdehyde dehydrogenase